MKLTIRGRHWINGHGQVFVVHPDDHDGQDMRKLKGQEVEADGKTWKVVGLETFAIDSACLPVGLLVKPVETHGVVV